MDKEVENGPEDATYVVRVTCGDFTHDFTFPSEGGSDSVTFDGDPESSTTCNVVETQTNGAVVDIEGNPCELTTEPIYEAPPEEYSAETVTTTKPPVIVGYTDDECEFEVSNHFEPTTTTTAPEPDVIVQQVPGPPAAPVIVRGPDFTG